MRTANGKRSAVAGADGHELADLGRAEMGGSSAAAVEPGRVVGEGRVVVVVGEGGGGAVVGDGFGEAVAPAGGEGVGGGGDEALPRPEEAHVDEREDWEGSSLPKWTGMFGATERLYLMIPEKGQDSRPRPQTLQTPLKYRV